MLYLPIHSNGAVCRFSFGHADLGKADLSEGFSPRQIAILREVYGKAHGRMHSNAYQAAVDVFDGHME